MGRGSLSLRGVWAATTLIVLCSLSALASVRPGLDVLRGAREAPDYLRGRRIGLVTNHTGRTVDGVSALQVLREEMGLDVAALFSPEHGFSGSVAAGDEVASTAMTAIPIHSLYGETRSPTPEMLAGLDVLVFDIQDIGTRFYTYISTMKLSIDAAAESGLAFVVLDRPNPLGGVRVEGPVLDPRFTSFVGIAPIALVHGMTAGELAHYFRERLPDPSALDLHVVRAEGLEREMTWSDTGLPWIAPSPNIRTPSAAIAYSATGLLEGIQVSEGRGVDETFERFGAPWIDGDSLTGALNALELPGVIFEPVTFTPRVTAAAPRPKFPGELCHGAAMRVVSAPDFEAVRTGLQIIAETRRLYPQHFAWIRSEDGFWIDRLLGTDRLRIGIDAGEGVDDLLARERSALEDFRARRAPRLLYD